jgi:predicted Zn-dependent protease
MLFADGGISENPKVAVQKSAEPKQEVVAQIKQSDEVGTAEAEPKESGKTRKQRIIEMAKAVAAAKDTNPVSETKAPIKPRKRKEASDSLIEEIQSTKEELAPSDEKLKHQIEVIDQFIKTQPTITNVKDKLATAPIGDLSSIKSGEFSDHIVSETLVEILIQQGKKDKAIEVLKKLIWKFPQKKAYFAAQIEELKK